MRIHKVLHFRFQISVFVFEIQLIELLTSLGYTGLQRFILFATENLTYNVMKCCLLIAIFVMFPDMFPAFFPSHPPSPSLVYDKQPGHIVTLPERQDKTETDDIAAR